MMRFRWLGLAVIGVLFSLCAIGTVEAQGAAYIDPLGRYSFTIPGGWRPAGPTPGAGVPAGMAVGGIFAAPAPLNGHLDVVTAPIPAGADPTQIDDAARSAGLDQFIDHSRGPVRVQQAPGGVRAVTVGGQSGDSQEFLFSPAQSGRLHAAQVTTVRGNVEYVLTLVAAEGDFDTAFQQWTVALSSFAFTGGGTGGATQPAVVTTLPSTGIASGARRPGERASLAMAVGGALIIAGVAVRRHRAARAG